MHSENRLISAILIQAVKDRDQPGHRGEVEAFVNSRWFSVLAEAIELDQARLRAKLAGGQVSGRAIRAAYRTGKPALS